MRTPSLFLLFYLLLISITTQAQLDSTPVDTRSHYYEACVVCADLLDAGEAIIKSTRNCQYFSLTTAYDVFDPTCIVENNSTRTTIINQPYIGEYLTRLNGSKCSLDARYIDFDFYYDKVDRSNFNITCLGDKCSVDVLVRQKFYGKGNIPATNYCDLTWKKFFFRLVWQEKKIKGKIIYITVAGRPQKCK